MAIATDAQVQVYVDTRLRVRAEQFRALVNSCRDDKVSIEDVYAACTQVEPTWTDNRGDGPPHLLAPSDVLVYNAILFMFLSLVDGTLTNENKAEFHSNWSLFQSACVRGA